MTVGAFGAVLGVIVALVAILKKVSPAYAMMFGALWAVLLEERDLLIPQVS